ncbi:MAG TPA: iron chaperone [Sphaerochaeta sp.]|jgi:hypothetical protein|nr:iron chaperone [Sphaerochaeta sp.]
MDTFVPFLAAIENDENRKRANEVLNWIQKTFPGLVPKIAWNQPMFTDHGTFIIGFSVSKQHLAVSPDVTGMSLFSEDIAKAGYSQTINLFRIKWEMAVDYALLEKIIQFNIDDKKDCKTFWKKV